MTRDPARIDPILADLRRYWHAAPDLRLGQMVMGLLDLSGAPRYGEFNAEDDKVAAYLAAWAAANHPPPDHRDTPPPEIEAAITAAAWSIAELDRRADVMAQPEIGALRTAITSALAAAREAGRREVLAERLVDGGPDLTLAVLRFTAGAIDSAEFGAAIAADKARAVEGMRPVLSQEDAVRLVAANDDETLAATGDTTARAALLAALTGAGGGR